MAYSASKDVKLFKLRVRAKDYRERASSASESQASAPRLLLAAREGVKVNIPPFSPYLLTGLESKRSCPTGDPVLISNKEK